MYHAASKNVTRSSVSVLDVGSCSQCPAYTPLEIIASSFYERIAIIFSLYYTNRFLSNFL